MVRLLACGLLDVLQEHAAAEGTKRQPGSWAGIPLYGHLDAVLQKRGSSADEMLTAMRDLRPSTEPWGAQQDDPHRWPCNFMPRLKHKLLAELSDWHAAGVPGLGAAVRAGIRHPHIHAVWSQPEVGERFRACYGTSGL